MARVAPVHVGIDRRLDRATDRPLDLGKVRTRCSGAHARTAIALRRPRYVEFTLRPTQRDVQESSFLVQRFGVATRVRDRYESFLEARDKHGVPLQALGAMERQEIDGVGRNATIVLAAQGGAEKVQEPRERRPATRDRYVLAPELGDGFAM